MDTEGYMTRLEAAAVLRASDQTVDRRIREGAIAAIRVGRKVLIPRGSVEEYMSRCRTDAIARLRTGKDQDRPEPTK